jgi:hypothetical protein
MFRTHLNQLWCPSSFLYHEYRVSFPWLKRPGRGVDHPPRSSAVVKERVELYHYFQSEPTWRVSGCGSCCVVDTKVVCICFERPVLGGLRCGTDNAVCRLIVAWPGHGVERRTQAKQAFRVRVTVLTKYVIAAWSVCVAMQAKLYAFTVH